MPTAAKKAKNSQDENLMIAIAHGDQNAYAALMDRYLAPIHALARRMTGDPILAEDIAQESFLRIWKSARSFSPKAGTPKIWISAIAINLCRDANRTRKRRYEDPDALLAIPDPRENVLAQMEIREREKSVRKALQELPERQREAVILFYDWEMKQAQIARTLHLSIEAVESLLARAKKNLRRKLQHILHLEKAPQTHRAAKG